MVEASEFLSRHAGLAYGLALSVTGEPAAAEDVVQEAFMRMIERGMDFGAEGAREYLASAVLNTARNYRRGEDRRRVREAAAADAVERTAGDGGLPAETRQAVRAALASLGEDRRLAVLLHVVDEFSQREVARILDLPVSTVSHRINQGLEELRENLVRAGLSALAGPAMAAALRGGAQLQAPAALMARISELASTVESAGAAGTAAKGGLLMKIGLGIAAAGLVAGGVFWAVGGKTEEPAKPKAPGAVERTPAAAEKKSKFDKPCWDPDARWQRDPSYFCGFKEVVQGGELDGPRRETMHCQGAGPGLPVSRMTQGGRSVFLSYDEKTERYHTSAGSAHGCLDGPFSRARFQGTDYVTWGQWLTSPGSRYGYYFSGFDYKMRLLDLEKQEVRTIFTDRSLYGASLTVDSAGRLLILKGNDLRFMNLEGKVEKTVPLKGDPPGTMFGRRGGTGVRILYDEVHDRLYGCSAQRAQWYLGYWDLKDGSFHGLIPVPKPDEPSRGKPGPGAGIPGPFKGTALYGEGDICFGPDDPEKRFLYMGQCDTLTGFRLDLEKQELWALSEEEKEIFSFIGTGKPKLGGRQVTYSWTGAIWAPSGNDFFGYVGDGYARYQRVK